MKKKISSPWMKFRNYLSKVVSVQMSVYFSGSDGFMTKHFLDSPKVCPSFQEMSGKRMPEGMGTDTFFQPYLPGKVFGDGKNHYS